MVGKNLGVSAYRKGRLPKTEFLYNLARFFDKPMEWFITKEEWAKDRIAYYKKPQDENLDDIALEEMCQILKKLMSNDNLNLREWTVVQFRKAFGEYC